MNDASGVKPPTQSGRRKPRRTPHEDWADALLDHAVTYTRFAVAAAKIGPGPCGYTCRKEMKMNSRKGGRMAWRLAMPQLLAIALMPPGAANAQSASVSPATQTDNGASAMKRLAYLVGSWAGMKKETGPDGKPQESLSTDDITAALDGEAIMIDGKAYGVGAAPSAKPIAKNFAVISAGAAPNRIRVTGFTPGGAVSSDGTVEADGSARWMMSWGSQILVFHIRPAAPDGWLETVKRSDDMGQTWHEFQIRFHRKEN